MKLFLSRVLKYKVGFYMTAQMESMPDTTDVESNRILWFLM